MKNPATLLLAAFFLLSAANLACSFAGWQTGIYLTKPLLMATLAGWFFVGTGRLPTTFHRLVFVGLLLSLVGDCLLMFADEKPNFFLLGLGSFLVAHLFYIAAFVKYPGWKNGWVASEIWPALPVLAFLIAMVFYLWPSLPEAFKIPVVVYAFTISAMLLCALNMVGRVASQTARWLAAGALLFVLSDSLIAVGKFKSVAVPAEVFSFGIMVTYLIGQFLIASRSREIYLPTN